MCCQEAQRCGASPRASAIEHCGKATGRSESLRAFQPITRRRSAMRRTVSPGGVGEGCGHVGRPPAQRKRAPDPGRIGGPRASRRKRKRPGRARRPVLPRADPAVLSAMAGLTAGFGMGPGDPCLHGRARAGRSRAGLIWPRPATAGPPRHPGGCTALVTSRSRNRECVCEEELGLLVPLG